MPAEKTFTIEYRVPSPTGPQTRVVTVDPAKKPSGGIGEPGSLLDLALGSDLDIDHACGGVAACSTCHVVVRQGLPSCNETIEAEEDMLDRAPGVTPQSRLACQCIPDGTENLIVEVPAWNRNLVREGN